MDWDLWCNRRADGRKALHTGSVRLLEMLLEGMSEWEMQREGERKTEKESERERMSGGEGYSCVARDHSRCGAIPLTDPNGPGRNDPRGDAEDQQHGAWADGHEGLHDEARVEVDLVEGTYTA